MRGKGRHQVSLDPGLVHVKPDPKLIGEDHTRDRGQNKKVGPSPKKQAFSLHEGRFE
jgi:hypothetical protein